MNVEFRLSCGFEGFRPAFQLIRGSVNDGAEGRIDKRVGIVVHIGNKGEADADLLGKMACGPGSVQENDLSLCYQDVVKRKGKGTPAFVGFLFLLSRQEIRKVVGSVGFANQMNVRTRQFDFVDDHGSPEQRHALQIQENLPESQKRFVAVPFPDGKTLHGQAESEGIERDCLDGDIPMQFPREFLDQDGFGKGGDDEKARHGEKNEKSHQPDHDFH